MYASSLGGRRWLDLTSVPRLRRPTDRRHRQGRLNQWAHWARAQGFRIFFSLSGAPDWLW